MRTVDSKLSFAARTAVYGTSGKVLTVHGRALRHLRDKSNEGSEAEPTGDPARLARDVHVAHRNVRATRDDERNREKDERAATDDRRDAEVLPRVQAWSLRVGEREWRRDRAGEHGKNSDREELPAGCGDARASAAHGQDGFT